MAIDLKQPISWKGVSPEEKALLRDLQGNILKGHGRDHVTVLFVQFKSGAAAAAKGFLREVATAHVRDALTHLSEAETFKATGKGGSVFVGIGVSAGGYAALGFPSGKVPADAAFRTGMRKRAGLKDPPVAKWEKGFRGAVHAVVLIADDLQGRVDEVRHQIEQALARLKAGKIVVREDGAALRNKHGDGIEHFGYVDGRSQPLMLTEDIQKEQQAGGIDQWDPRFGIGTALVPDPGSKLAGFGSYLVFRKLEQNVRGFKEAERKLAKKLQLAGAQAELAGALVVGRFEDGTPVVLQRTDGIHPVANNFAVSADPDGTRCPFAGHIRKTNPRGDSMKLGATLESERGHLMPRRGIPFGVRATHPNDPVLEEEPTLYPRQGVGLLFMAYNAEIGRQFEFTQETWVNNRDFARGATGIDGVIGQGKNASGLQTWPKVWGQAKGQPMVAFDFSGFVTMKGGEYFFAPSIGFLRGL